MANLFEQDGLFIRGKLNTESGVLELEKFPHIVRHIKKLCNEEMEVELRIKPLKYQRSDAQNRYYWGVAVVTIMAFLQRTQGRRFSREEVHAVNLAEVAGKTMEFKEIMNPKTGKPQTIAVFEGKSTSQMNTKEFTEFIDNLVAYWADVDCIIPLPKEKPSPNFITDFLDDD